MTSWSDIPGTDTECVTIVGFVVKTRSNNSFLEWNYYFCFEVVFLPTEFHSHYLSTPVVSLVG